jgi:hypothetical protein
MKKTYAAPTVFVSGTVVQDTRTNVSSGLEIDGKFELGAGRVGFYL